ncbi:HSP20-like chaperone [Phaeosphaeriaceae sp. PMI808]|nr:HSP20-like chaperone [Phaeosphaeriaceae sp. PMI808]
MPSVTYMNQSAPFWDFIAGLEQQGNNHPFFSPNRNNENEGGEGNENNHDASTFGPWGWGGNFFGGRGFPHRGPPTPAGPAPNHHGEEDSGQVNEKCNEKDNDKEDENNDEKMKDANDNGEGPSGCSGSDNEGCARGRGRHGRCGGGRRRGHCGPGGFGGPWQHGGPRHGHHSHGFSDGPHCGPRHGPRGFGRRGGWGPWGHGGFGGGFDPSALAAHFWNQFNDTQSSNADTNKASANDNGDHTPDVDVFDGETAFVIHVSLPGAKKEDVGVNWDAEKSELSVAGVIYRPGNEEFLRTLAMNERKVGPFERKIRLGTRATPAHIDADSIIAKLEDGILRVEVPKLDSGYVEVRKVDIN